MVVIGAITMPVIGAGFIPTIDGGEDGEVVLDGEVGDSPPPCGLICTMLREFQVQKRQKL